MAIEFLTIGAMLVEIMRTELDVPLSKPGALVGPFPSGGSAIFIDGAARLGNSCAMISVVGQDEFGECLLNRFRTDGIDLSMVRVDPTKTTSTAFVSYFSDGSRKFIYHVKDAASSGIGPDDVKPELIQDLKWFHLSSNVITGKASIREAVWKVIGNLPSQARISLDPNIRAELKADPAAKADLDKVVHLASVIFPSEGEAMALTGDCDDDQACRNLASSGKLVVCKMGKQGCRIYDGEIVQTVDSFVVDEIDPTGAGDSFAAGFLTGMELGLNLHQCGVFANAVGALAVTKKGPMEGAPYLKDVLHLVKQQTGVDLQIRLPHKQEP